ncbi:pre-mRNA-splicing factor 38-like [Dioscorea cayenensis subsp. rotundata]|uniref:Pre-mRNA-splicing factor 38 n=1 Tax=Dioscorea cayennensis subsp. rotundata TaxID=55577 RepID=A0AB40BMB0_DIOCR|nr:pre-mRNA-splicing factor 38-like [Dioscorea cayenensis subsp. rotundata]
MANRTDPLAKSIHGTNPQNLVEKIVRSKIYESTFWKEQCFGLTAETLVDKAMELDHLGGTYGGNRRPTPFMCLVMKMLQIQPPKDIVAEFILNTHYKYVRVLGAFYMRLTGTVTDVHSYLWPLYNDNRKLRRKMSDGSFSLTHVDEVIDELLTMDHSGDIALPRIRKRWPLEAAGVLEPWQSVLDGDFEKQDEKEEEEQPALEDETHEKDYRGRSPGRDGERYRKRAKQCRDRDRVRDKDYDREYARGQERDSDHDQDRYRDLDRDCYRLRDERDYVRDRDRDREWEGWDRHRRDRDRARRRNRSRSRSNDRRERHRDDINHRKSHACGSISPHRRLADDSNSREEQPKKKKGKEKKSDSTDHSNPEIAEANRLRASLGLASLR